MDHRAPKHPIRVAVQIGNAFEVEGDALVLGHDAGPFEAQVRTIAQRLLGDSLRIDEEKLRRLVDAGVQLPSRVLAPGASSLIDSLGAARAPKLLLVGIEHGPTLGYEHMRSFAAAALAALARSELEPRHLLMQVPGPAGLDEFELLASMLDGLLQAANSGQVPARLRKITLVESNPVRATLFKRALGSALPKGIIRRDEERAGGGGTQVLRGGPPGADVSPSTKPNVFVAMPFSEEFEDVYHYGIQQPVRAAGFVCERADLASFTGAVMSWVQQRIDTASLVIADLSHANPNVYLEVGYAWGRNRPTVLLVRDEDTLCFDVRDQRCLVYSKIKELEQKLSRELSELANARP